MRTTEGTRKEAYPLPRMDDILELMKGVEYFTTLDLARGYWQVAVLEQDPRLLSAITTDCSSLM